MKTDGLVRNDVFVLVTSVKRFWLNINARAAQRGTSDSSVRTGFVLVAGFRTGQIV